MNNIPKKIRDEMSEDKKYKKCSISLLKDCSGRIEWHHNMTYSGRQIQEKWAIISICYHHHSIVTEQKIRKVVDWITLNRLFNLPPEELAVMESKYKKAFPEWKRKVTFLNKLYGRYNGDKKK